MSASPLAVFNWKYSDLFRVPILEDKVSTTWLNFS